MSERVVSAAEDSHVDPAPVVQDTTTDGKTTQVLSTCYQFSRSLKLENGTSHINEYN